MLRRALLVLALCTLAVGAAPALAQASGSTTPVGAVSSARQDVFNHVLSVWGWAYVPARSASSIDVRIYVDGHYAGHVPANLASAGLDAARHITGRHTFHLVRSWTARAARVTAVSTGLTSTGSATTLQTASVTHVQPAPGARIIAIAKRFVGARYVDGGASPGGFDCSGYTQYVYAHAYVRTLPHNAEAQRRLRGMRLLSRSAARPGDLVFYLSGGSAYHVAIYAGNGMQYAAATPRDGVRYQIVWSSRVEYRTTWH